MYTLRRSLSLTSAAAFFVSCTMLTPRADGSPLGLSDRTWLLPGRLCSCGFVVGVWPTLSLTGPEGTVIQAAIERLSEARWQEEKLL